MLYFRDIMVRPRHGASTSGVSDEAIRQMIQEEVAAAIRAEIPEMFGSIKTTLMETFDERYAALTEAATAAATAAVAAARPQGGDSLLFREFSNTKPPEFDGTQDPIAAMRWIADIEGCFYTCSCPEHLRVRFALNQLRLGAKDWWKFVTANFTLAETAAVTWEGFTTMFRDEYVPPVERERLVQEFLALKQGTDSVAAITRKFHERAMFCPELVATEQARMSRYLGVLRREIREFVSNSTYHTFTELQANARKREIELETQAREEAESQQADRRPAQSQPAAKRIKSADSRTGGSKNRTCVKCGKGHDGACRAGACYKCGKEGHIARECPKGFMVCFHCNQTGHRKAECPQLRQGSAPVARTTETRPVKVEAPRARGRAFQLTAEEVRAAPDVVAGTSEDRGKAPA
ncbi:uncharacterized protein LOC128127083 [Lactuca sativa]|uniref:uncharacterized protein LOC128127083 n=3 Tax=Lactuca sativa TaxID=4236 RepID=UPI0022AEC57C|nr:uncharacterized protein LOC128127083 [Lactuca sativa]